MSAEQRYKFHRTARYLLAVPMVFLLDWWAASLILAVLPFEGALRIAVFAAIFASCFGICLKGYKNFKPSKLFIKNPNFSLLLFAVENLSLGAFYGGFLTCLAAGYFWGERAAVWSIAFVIVAPVCLLVFVISYMFNEKES